MIEKHLVFQNHFSSKIIFFSQNFKHINGTIIYPRLFFSTQKSEPQSSKITFFAKTSKPITFLISIKLFPRATTFSKPFLHYPNLGILSQLHQQENQDPNGVLTIETCLKALKTHLQAYLAHGSITFKPDLKIEKFQKEGCS